MGGAGKGGRGGQGVRREVIVGGMAAADRLSGKRAAGREWFGQAARDIGLDRLYRNPVEDWEMPWGMTLLFELLAREEAGYGSADLRRLADQVRVLRAEALLPHHRRPADAALRVMTLAESMRIPRGEG